MPREREPAAAPGRRPPTANQAGGKTVKPPPRSKPVQPIASEIGAVAERDGASRPKLVRDSFTMPKPEYSVLNDLKLRAGRLGRPTKKGELLRAGVAALRAMSDPTFLAALAVVPTLKPGRPRNSNGVAVQPDVKAKKRRKAP